MGGKIYPTLLLLLTGTMDWVFSKERKIRCFGPLAGTEGRTAFIPLTALGDHPVRLQPHILWRLLKLDSVFTILL